MDGKKTRIRKRKKKKREERRTRKTEKRYNIEKGKVIRRDQIGKGEKEAKETFHRKEEKRGKVKISG